MHVDRVRAGVKSLREQAEKAGRDWKQIEICPQFVVHLGKTHEQAIASFRKSQMNKHLVSLSKSTLKGQGAATHEEINLIGTPAEVVEKALAFKEAGVTHLLGLYFGRQLRAGVAGPDADVRRRGHAQGEMNLLSS